MIHPLVPDGEFLKSLKVHGGQRGWRKKPRISSNLSAAQS